MVHTKQTRGGTMRRKHHQGLVVFLLLLLLSVVAAFWIQPATPRRKILVATGRRWPSTATSIQSTNNEYLQSLSSSSPVSVTTSPTAPTAPLGRAAQEALTMKTMSHHCAPAARQGAEDHAMTSKFVVSTCPPLDAQQQQEEDDLVVELQDLTNTLQEWTARNGQTIEENHSPMHSPNAEMEPAKTGIHKDPPNDTMVKGRSRLFRATNNIYIGDLVSRATSALVDFCQGIVEVLQVLVSQTKPGRQLQEAVSSTGTQISNIVNQSVSSIQETTQDIANISVGQVCQQVLDVMRATLKRVWEALDLLIYLTSHKDVLEWKQAATQSWQDARERVAATANDFSQKSVYDLIVILGKFELGIVEAIPKTANKAWKFIVLGFARNKRDLT